MSRRRHVKPVRQTAEFVGFPKLIEGEDYTLIVILLIGITMGLFVFTFPKYLFAGVAFDVFLLVIWQFYSGVALKAGWSNRKIIAKHTREDQPRLFYRTLMVWGIAGLAALVSFFIRYFLLGS